ncbi:hypothetical protein H4R35_002103 [Dimargaris xerosporica]|nr:hypothetical protein H4R35_002103 [Dimargaris xerosporica]
MASSDRLVQELGREVRALTGHSSGGAELLTHRFAHCFERNTAHSDPMQWQQLAQELRLSHQQHELATQRLVATAKPTASMAAGKAMAKAREALALAQASLANITEVGNVTLALERLLVAMFCTIIFLLNAERADAVRSRQQESDDALVRQQLAHRQEEIDAQLAHDYQLFLEEHAKAMAQLLKP